MSEYSTSNVHMTGGPDANTIDTLGHPSAQGLQSTMTAIETLGATNVFPLHPHSNAMMGLPLMHTNDDAVLKLKGLPYSTTSEQIYEFFKDFKVKTVAFVEEPDHRPSGLAFAEFETKEEALKALSRNGEYIGDRYVRLLHVPKSEMEEQVRLGTLAIPGAAAKLRSRLLRTQHRVAGYVTPQILVPTMVQTGGARPIHMAIPQTSGMLPQYSSSPMSQGLAHMDTRLWQQYPTASAIPLHQQFAQISLGNQRPSSFSLLGNLHQQGQHLGNAAHMGHLAMAAPHTHLPQGSSGSPSNRTSSGGPQLSAEHAAASLAGLPLGTDHQTGAANHMGLNSPVHPSSTYPGHLPGQIMQVSTYPPGSGVMPGAAMLSQGLQVMPPASVSNMQAAMLKQGMPAPLGTTVSATVKVRGLPYRSSPAEILQFFSGYQYLPDSLQIGLDASSRPSGEAWLTFASPSEAARAVKELNRRYLGTRYLELSCC